MFANALRRRNKTIQNAARQPAAPCRTRSRHLHPERRARLRMALPRQHEQRGPRIFHGAAKPEPGSHRNPVNRLHRQIAQIHRDQPKAAALHQQIHSFERMLGVAAAPYPEHLRKPNSRRRGACGIEPVAGIDQRAEFLPRADLRHQGMEQGSTAGRHRSGNLRQSAPRDLTHGRRQCLVSGLFKVEGGIAAITQSGLNLFTKECGGHWHIRLMFAYNESRSQCPRHLLSCTPDRPSASSGEAARLKITPKNAMYWGNLLWRYLMSMEFMDRLAFINRWGSSA